MASKAETPTFGAAFYSSLHITTIHHARESPTLSCLLIDFCGPSFLFGLLCLMDAFFFLIGYRNQFKW
jgi:hypothetical protein